MHVFAGILWMTFGISQISITFIYIIIKFAIVFPGILGMIAFLRAIFLSFVMPVKFFATDFTFYFSCVSLPSFFNIMVP